MNENAEIASQIVQSQEIFQENQGDVQENQEEYIDLSTRPPKIDPRNNGAKSPREFIEAKKIEQKYRKREAAWQAEREQLLANQRQVESLNELKELGARNPLELMDKFGLTYEQVTDYILKSTLSPEELKIEELRNEIESYKKQQEEEKVKLTQAQAERTIQNFKTDIDRFIRANAEKYEYTSQLGGTDLVYNTVEQWFAKTNEVLSIEKATEMVENYLDSEADKLLRVSKLQSKLKPLRQNVLSSYSYNPSTLSNSIHTGVATRQLTREEAIREAAKTLAKQKPIDY